MTVAAPVAVVPAAGLASRFGGAKLLAPIAGEPLLAHTLRCLLDGGVGRVIVVTAPGVSFAGVAATHDTRVSIVENPDPSRGMFSSIQTALAHAEASSVLVMPADMPFVRSATVAAVVAAASKHDRWIAPAHGGRRGHPIAIPWRLRAALLQTDATGSLRDALRSLGEEVMAIDVDDPGVLRDVDTKEDLQ